MKYLGHWVAAVTGAAALSALALVGCGDGDDNKANPPTDGGTDSSVTDGGTADANRADSGVADGSADAAADSAPDAVTDAAPCPLDADLLTPVDAAANPVTAACQACIANPSSMVPSVAGSGTCLAAFVACNANCSCKEAVVSVAQCLAMGTNTLTCIGHADAGMENIFGEIVACQGGPCSSACSGRSVSDAGDAGDAAADGGIADAAADAPDGHIADAAADAPDGD